MRAAQAALDGQSAHRLMLSCMPVRLLAPILSGMGGSGVADVWRMAKPGVPGR